MERPNIVAQLFTPDVVTRLENLQRPPASRYDSAGAPLRKRHLLFSDRPLDFDTDRVRRAAWWSYLECAERLGLLDDDLRARLIGIDDDNFRGALAECMSVWFLHQKLDLPVVRVNAPSGVRRPDFDVGDAIRIEIKAPHVPVTSRTFSGDDSSVLVKCVQSAGKQLKKQQVNIVVIVAMLRSAVWTERWQLVKAVLGEWAWAVPVSITDEPPDIPAHALFLQTGKLAKLFRASDGGTHTDLTRVSAVMTLEEEVMATDKGSALRHFVLVAHNPFAHMKLDQSIFAEYPQLVESRPGEMAWTDKPNELNDSEL